MSAIEAQSAGVSSPGGSPPAMPAGSEWPLCFSVLAYGVRIGVRVSHPVLAENLTGHLPPGSELLEFSDAGRVYSLVAEPTEGSVDRCSLFVDKRAVARRVSVQAALRAFEANVQIYVAEMSPERVFVHAGVVGWRGRAILLPGRSFCGKTTLVAALVRAGAEYYSDEYAAIDSAGGVHAYPRLLSVREEGGPGVQKYSVEALGGRAGSDPIPVGLIVMSRYKPGSEWRPDRLSPGRGILALLANTVPARRTPEVVMPALYRVVSEAAAIRSDRGEACSVVAPILELAEQQ